MPRLAKPAQGKYADFARSVRALREDAGLSVQDLSDASGVPLSSIYASESGTRLPTEDNITAMAPALGIDAEAAVELRQSAAANAYLAEASHSDPPTNPHLLQTSEDLAGYLRSLRTRAGALPLRALARKANTSPSSLSRILQGAALPQWDSLRSLLMALEASEAEREAVLECWRRLQSARASRPTTQTLALLYGAATSCAYPGCTVALVDWNGEQPNLAVEIAHIDPIRVAPRSDQFDNLILLCPNHHRSHYDASPEDLRTWKADQAARARKAARPQGTTSSTSLPSAINEELPPAFAAFHTKSKTLYLAYAKLHLGNLAEAEEFVDQVFEKIHAQWDRLRLTNAPQREGFDILASSVRDALRPKTGNPSPATDRQTSPHTSRTWSPQSAEHDLLERITELPPRLYNILVLRHLLGCSDDETARLMGLTGTTLRAFERIAQSRLKAAGSEFFADQVTAEKQR